ncbi:MAG: glycosyltransferase family 39 protein [Thermoflexus sp.]
MQRAVFIGTLILLVAAALRLAEIGRIPPGLYHDEAYYGLDAMDVLRGHLQVYFPANNGREPLFVYMTAGMIGLLGRSPFALRLTSAFVGMLTVAATMAAGRALFSQRIGLLAAAVLAVTLWHVHLSRVGFRVVTLPLLLALMVWLGARAVRTGRSCLWLATGALYGLSFYTYTAARFTPFALAMFGLYVLATFGPRALRPHARGIGLATVTAVVILTPLLAYTAFHPDVVLSRPDQVSIWNPAISGGDPWGTLGRHLLRTLGMFFVQGDRIWRHNVPWRPVFGPLLGAAFLLGIGVAFWRARRNSAAGLALIWTVVMALPTVLAEDAPHFLRAVGMLPILAFLPALGMDRLMGAPKMSVLSRLNLLGPAAGIIVIGLELTSVVPLYFGPYAHNPMTSYWFERGAVALGADINRFLDAGWAGEASPATPTAGPDGHVYLDPVLWESWPQVRFLVAAPERVTVGLEVRNELLDAHSESHRATQWRSEQYSIGAKRPLTAVFLWPYGDWTRAWTLLPHPAEVTVIEGPLSQHDRDTEPYITYLAFLVTRPDPAIPPQARLFGGVEWLGAAIAPRGDGSLWVRLRWRATAPLAEEYVVFLHYRRDGQTIAQGDSPPAGGRYPTSIWRPGDVINDDHILPGVGLPQPGRDEIVFGLWNPQTGEYLSVLDGTGHPAGVEIRMRVP